jgi:hypothetical protein
MAMGEELGRCRYGGFCTGRMQCASLAEELKCQCRKGQCSHGFFSCFSCFGFRF